MNIKTWEIILLVIIMAGLSLVPAIFDVSIVHYVVGVVSVIAILTALAFFLIKTGTPIPDEKQYSEPVEDTGKTKCQMCWKRIKRCWQRFSNACNSVGFILFLCILLIIGIGVFDSLMGKNNEVNSQCDCKLKAEMYRAIPPQIDSLPQGQSELVH